MKVFKTIYVVPGETESRVANTRFTCGVGSASTTISASFFFSSLLLSRLELSDTKVYEP